MEYLTGSSGAAKRRSTVGAGGLLLYPICEELKNAQNAFAAPLDPWRSSSSSLEDNENKCFGDFGHSPTFRSSFASSATTPIPCTDKTMNDVRLRRCYSSSDIVDTKCHGNCSALSLLRRTSTTSSSSLDDCSINDPNDEQGIAVRGSCSALSVLSGSMEDIEAFLSGTDLDSPSSSRASSSRSASSLEDSCREP